MLNSGPQRLILQSFPMLDSLSRCLASYPLRGASDECEKYEPQALQATKAVNGSCRENLTNNA
jgi:hypothetical protein